MEEKNSIDDVVDAAKGAVKWFAKKGTKTILASLAPILIPVILVIMVIIFVIGATHSFKSSMMDFFNTSDEYTSDVAIRSAINDTNRMYELLKEGKFDLNASDFILLDEATILRIFERIYEHNLKQDKETRIRVTYRVEKKTDSNGNPIELEEMDVYGTIPSDSLEEKPEHITYDDETIYGVRLNDIEHKKSGETGYVFDVRWQPIVALCSVVAQDNYNRWGDGNDIDSSIALKDLDVTNYYLTNAQIDSIIDVFCFRSSFYYNPIMNGRDYYSFTDFMEYESGFQLEVYDTETERVTRRRPWAAPISVSNSYVSYTYQYDENMMICQRDKVINPAGFFSAVKRIDPDFEMDNFLLNLAQLPEAYDLYAYYSSDDFINCKIEREQADTWLECSSIGTFYNGNNSGGAGTVSGDTFGIPIYDYENPNTAHLGEVHLFVNKVSGEDYGVYRVSVSALKPFTQSDNLSLEQIEYVLANSSYHANSGCILFNSEENRKKTAQVLYDYQQNNNVSVLFYLAIMRTEGAIKGSYGKTYYNYFNFTSSTYIIPGSSGFRDYKAEYGENGAWDALETQLSQIYNRYAVDRGQINYFLMCWRGYDGYNWSSISMSYCPAFDDLSMPWAAGSYYVKDGVTRQINGGNGWVNNNVIYRDDLEMLVKNGYPDWEGNVFTSEDVIDTYYGPQLSEWIERLN